MSVCMCLCTHMWACVHRPIVHANHDVSSPSVCSQFPWLHLFGRAHTWERGEWGEELRQSLWWRALEKGKTQEDGGETVWNRGLKQTRQTDACGVGKKEKKKPNKSPVLCVLLSESTGEQVSEYWSSGCHDDLHEPTVYVLTLKKRGAEKQRRRACALPSLGFFCFRWDPHSESTGISSTIWFPWWRQGAICPLQTGKTPAWSLLGSCFLVWIGVWTLDMVANLCRATNEPLSCPSSLSTALSSFKRRENE